MQKLMLYRVTVYRNSDFSFPTCLMIDLWRTRNIVNKIPIIARIGLLHFRTSRETNNSLCRDRYSARISKGRCAYLWRLSLNR